MTKILKKFFGDSNERVAEKFQSLVDEINKLEPKFENFNNEEFKKTTVDFKKRLNGGETLDDVLPESFALVREAAKRTLGQRHFDVQLLGGVVLHRGMIAEMKTGEGKTLTATLPVYLNALTDEGVHVVTVNDYLARRDAVWMGQIYNLLGFKIACLNSAESYIYDETYKEEESSVHDKERDVLGSFRVFHEFLRPVLKEEAYQADIIYGTNSEFGFDFLRDNLAYNKSQIAQKIHNFAIIDEVDSILIDEARTPLIISAPAEESAKLYKQFAEVAPKLKEEDDYEIDEKRRAVTLTDKGIGRVEDLIGSKSLYESGNLSLLHHLEQALKAEFIFERDKDYVVRDGEVIIVDEFTGRLLPSRRYSDGLHQALEAKEKVEVKKESRTLASITFQNYFRMYEKLAGMTGTALTSSEEFHKVYNLEAVPIPTNEPLIRKELPDVIHKTHAGKWQGVVAEVKKRHTEGQPVLIGTTSIEKNEYLSKLLNREGISHKLLNAKNHEQEAEIVAQAGRLGAVTLATNIAGRGVDIILGGNPQNKEEYEKIIKLGGLYILGTERHEARRIDNQLRGRAGRQGDPGFSRFFVSLEDDLMRIFGGENLKKIMDSLRVPDDLPIENKIVSRAIEKAQERIEGYNFDLRKHVLEYDDVVNRQRTTVYKKRRQVLFDEIDIKKEVLNLFYGHLERLIETEVLQSERGELPKEKVIKYFESILPQEIKIDEDLLISSENKEILLENGFKFLEDIFNKKEENFGKEAWEGILRQAYLQVSDIYWMGQLEELGYLRNVVGLRAYGQKDPLVEYKKEAKFLYQDFWVGVGSTLAASIFKVEQVKATRHQEQYQGGRESISATSLPQAPAASRPQAQAPDSKKQFGRKIGRNEPCPCGSGKKYKKCHGR
jgi:preprotein translocase subunit SecA